MAISVQKVLTKIFGSRNERLLKRYRSIVAQVNAAESKVQPMTDDQLRHRTLELREGLTGGKLRSADVLHEAMAIIRESMDRNIGIRSIFNPEENFNPNQLEGSARQPSPSHSNNHLDNGTLPPAGCQAGGQDMATSESPPRSSSRGPFQAMRRIR